MLTEARTAPEGEAFYNGAHAADKSLAVDMSLQDDFNCALFAASLQ